MTTPRLLVLPPLFALLVPVGSVTATDDARDHASFAYEHGFTASGAFTGTCDATGVQFAGYGTQGVLRFHADAASLIVYRTWYNETILFPDGPIPGSFNTRVEQTHEVVPVPNGSLALEWHPGSRWYLSESTLDDAGTEPLTVGNLSARVEGSSWLSEASDRYLSAGPGTYHWPTRIGILRLSMTLPGPARFLHTNQPVIPIEGDGWLIFDNATLAGNAFRLQMPDYAQEVRHEKTTPVTLEWSFLLTHAALHVRGLRAQVDPAWVDLGCRNLDWSGAGVVTYRRAVGSVRRADESYGFERQELTLEGEFASQERPRLAERPWGQVVEVGTESGGVFDVAAIDYAVVADGPVRAALPDLAKVSLFALVVAASGYVLYKAAAGLQGLFSRELRGGPLEHEARALIDAAVRQRPGVNLRELERLTGKPFGVVRHHVRVLRRHGVLTMHPVGREQCLYPVGVSAPDARRHRLLDRDPAVRCLVEFLRGGAQPVAAGLDAVQSRFGFSRSGASRALGRAQAAGLVVREQTDAGVVLRAA